MPYSIVDEHEACPAARPVGVVKDGAEERPLGCHPNRDAAQRQIAALNAAEDEDGDHEGDGPMMEDSTVGQAWRAPNGIVHEGVLTGDGRRIEAGALEWEGLLPIPLRWQREDRPGHEGAVLVGRIDSLERDGDRIVASGVFATTDEAVQAASLVGDGFLRGVSVDLDDVVADMMEGADGETILSVTKGRVRAATLVDIPAFAGAEIELVDATEVAAAVKPVVTRGDGSEIPMGSFTWTAPKGTPGTSNAINRVLMLAGAGEDQEPVLPEGSAFSVVASADTLAPPSSYFTDPGFATRRGLHVGAPDADGWTEVIGHIYGWGECHIGSPPGRCVQIPRGCTQHSVFADPDGRGVLCADGARVATGPIVLAADHADLSLRWLGAKSHYDHTGLAVADVACGEDDHGVWVHGVIRPGTPAEMVHALRASAPSGDWRAVGGRLELVAILAVNTPGFPATAAHIEGGQVLSLVASGGRIGSDCGCGGSCASCAAQDGGVGLLRVALARLDAQGREIDALRALTASARMEAIRGLEASLGVASVAEQADALEASLLG